MFLTNTLGINNMFPQTPSQVFHVFLLLNELFNCLRNAHLKVMSTNLLMCFYVTAKWIDASVDACSSYKLLYDTCYKGCCYEPP